MNMIWISHEHKRPTVHFHSSIVRDGRAITSKQRSNWYTTHPLYTINTNHIWLTFFSLSSSLVIVVHWFCFVLFGFCVCSQRNYIVDLLRVYYWIETYPSMFYCHLRQPIIYLVAWPIQSRAMIVWQYESYTIDIDCCCCWCWWWWWFLSPRASTMMSTWEQAYLFRIFFFRL